MYRLFNRIKNGLDPVALIFRKHVESEGMKIVNQATEDATAKKEKDAGVCVVGCVIRLVHMHAGFECTD